MIDAAPPAYQSARSVAAHFSEVLRRVQSQDVPRLRVSIVLESSARLFPDTVVRGAESVGRKVRQNVVRGPLNGRPHVAKKHGVARQHVMLADAVEERANAVVLGFHETEIAPVPRAVGRFPGAAIRLHAGHPPPVKGRVVRMSARVERDRRHRRISDPRLVSVRVRIGRRRHRSERRVLRVLDDDEASPKCLVEAVVVEHNIAPAPAVA